MRSARTLNNTTSAEANYKVCLIGVGDFSMSPMQRHIARSGAQRKSWRARRKPWLVSKEWRERRIVSQGVRGSYFALALAVIGPMAILAVTVGIWHIVEGNPEGWGALLAGATVAGVLAYVTYQWLAWRKFGKSVCHLETLPGVIGGWFKASVEVKLPVETRPAVLVTLGNVLDFGSPTVWEISEHVFHAQLTRIQGDRYLVPVRFHIPARKDYYVKPTWNPNPFTLKLSGVWVLKIRAELPGMNLGAGFLVPIFETDEAPPEEQTPEGGLWTVEVVVDNDWYVYDKDFDSKLIAKAGRENTFSGNGRVGERDLGWYFQTEAEAQECADKFRGDPTLLRVRVYDEEHQ